jgi:hypothetical protein
VNIVAAAQTFEMGSWVNREEGSKYKYDKYCFWEPELF